MRANAKDLKEHLVAAHEHVLRRGQVDQLLRAVCRSSCAINPSVPQSVQVRGVVTEELLCAFPVAKPEIKWIGSAAPAPSEQD